MINRSLSDEQLVLVLLESPWERLLGESRAAARAAADLRSWLCKELVGAARTPRSVDARPASRALLALPTLARRSVRAA